MATLEEIMAVLNAGGSASNMSSSDLATLMSGGGAMSSGAGSPYTDYGGTNAWTDPNSPEFKSRMDTLTNTMLSGQRNQVEDYVRRAALSGVQRGGYNVAGAPNYAGGLQREAINALAGGYDTRYTNALNYLMNAGTLNEKGIERSFTAEQNSKQQAATAALQKAGFDQQTAERIAGETFTGGENTKARDLQVKLQQAGFDQQTAERLAGQVFTATENATQRGWQSGENTSQRDWQGGQNDTQRAWQSGENTAQRGWQGGQNDTQRAWQSGESGIQRTWQAGQTDQTQTWQGQQNALQLAQQKAIADQNYQIALKNATTQSDKIAADQAYQQKMQQLEQDKFDLQKAELNKPLPTSVSPPSSSGSGSPSGSGGKSGGSGSNGSGPPGLEPSANITPLQQGNIPIGQGYSEWKGGDESKVGYPWGAPGYEGYQDWDTFASSYDPSLMGYTQAGADQGSFAPTPEEYQNSWTGSTNNDYYDYNYDSGGQAYNDSWSDFG